jgi:hypothetical protein
MRVYLIVAWLFIGLGGVIYHLGPGQRQMELDHLDQLLGEARRCVADQHWTDAIEFYDQALAKLPGEKIADAQALVLEKAKAQMMAKQLPQARDTLEQLFREVLASADPDPHFAAEVEATLANAQYYMTWLMRLEGFSKEEWLPEIEASRQHYTQLYLRAQERGDGLAMARNQEDLEAAVRLARMDLTELQSLPLPSQ